MDTVWTSALRLLDEDLARRDTAARTRRAYKTDLGQFAEWATERGLAPASIRVADLRRYMAALSMQGAAPTTSARKLAALRALFRSQHEHGQVAHSPAELVSAPRRPRKLPRVLKAREAASLLDSIPASGALELRDRAMFELAYSCGLRAEELVTLRPADLDHDAEQLRVQGKGRKTRVVPVGELAQRAVDDYLERGRGKLLDTARPQSTEIKRTKLAAPNVGSGVGARASRPDTEQALFLSKSGRRLSTSDVRRRLRGWAQRAGVESATGAVNPHALRHSFATHLLDGGADLRSIQELLGHASVSSTQIYTRVESAKLKSAYARSHRGPDRDRDQLVTMLGTTGRTRMETNVKAIELRELWRRYKSDGDQRARERLVVAYSPLVKYVAGRTAAGLPPHVEEADLISYGLSGLIAAIERFDPSREIKFETYAIMRIKGAIIDELRAMDWVPRSVRARAREVERANAKLEHTLQRAPTDKEIAAEMKVSVEELNESLLAISHSSMVALDELWSTSDSSGDQVSLMDTLEDTTAPDPAKALDVGDLKDRIADSIATLPEREKLVIALYYYENLTLREIGEVLGVTESRVSQLHTKAVLRLRSRMQEEAFEA